MVGEDSPGAAEEAHFPAVPARVEWVNFLSDSPPEVWVDVANAATRSRRSGEAAFFELATPTLFAECSSDICADGHPRRFEPHQAHTSGSSLTPAKPKTCFLGYRCVNCISTYRVFALWIKSWSPDGTAKALKIGQMPPPSDTLSAADRRAFGTSLEIFRKGYQLESRGYGIGAFAYLRLLVEEHAEILIEQVIKAARAQKAGPTDIEKLERLRGERKFSVVADELKPLLPPALTIGGHNPLSLLHSALSRGLHPGLSDQECLSIAREIRTVLLAVVRRVRELSSEAEELSKALGSLTRIPPESSK